MVGGSAAIGREGSGRVYGRWGWLVAQTHFEISSVLVGGLLLFLSLTWPCARIRESCEEMLSFDKPWTGLAKFNHPILTLKMSGNVYDFMTKVDSESRAHRSSIRLCRYYWELRATKILINCLPFDPLNKRTAPCLPSTQISPLLNSNLKSGRPLWTRLTQQQAAEVKG